MISFDSLIFPTTIEPSLPEFAAICLKGVSQALLTISKPTFWSLLVVLSFAKTLAALTNTTPPPGTIPSSTAARVELAKIEQRQDALSARMSQFEEDRAELRSDYFIFVNDNGFAKKTKVDVGLSDDEYQELMSEIDENVEVVVGPNQELRHLLEGDRLDATRIDLQ